MYIHINIEPQHEENNRNPNDNIQNDNSSDLSDEKFSLILFVIINEESVSPFLNFVE